MIPTHSGSRRTGAPKWLLLVLVIAVAGCSSEEAPVYERPEAPQYEPLLDDPAPVAPPQVEPDYPPCFAAGEGEVCEELGKVKVKPIEPDYPPCFAASEGEVCEEYGKVKVKPPDYPSCFAALPGEVCEEFGTLKVKE